MTTEKIKKLFALAMIPAALLFHPGVMAQTGDDSINEVAVKSVQKKETITREVEPQDYDYTSHYYFISQKEFWLAIAVLGALVAIIVLEMRLIRERRFNDETALRLLVVTIVIVSSLFIIISGYDERQIAPIYGLFGTICGYLFGRSERKNDNNGNPTKPES